jgi:alginate O-acetyltransferase complex protein AlgI
MISINTEITELAGEQPGHWIFYDGACRICVAWAERFGPVLRRHGFGLAPLQTAWVRHRLRLEPSELLREMRLLREDGRIFGGADALVQVSRRVWWAWPVYAASRLPGALPLLRALYRWFAARRGCAANACSVRPTRQWGRLPACLRGHPARDQARRNSRAVSPLDRLEACPTTSVTLLDWPALLILPAAAWWMSFDSPGWVQMWALALAVGLGCKWATWRRAKRRLGHTGLGRSLLYLFAWPGMEAETFLAQTHQSPLPSPREWLSAFLQMLLGVVLVWFGARCFTPGFPLLAGWIGLTGLGFLLHFGLFKLLSLTWQSFGIAASPLMRAPMLTRSLGEFWSMRWNAAFSQLAHAFIFMQLRRRFGITGATLTVFLISGTVHDFVISVPARAGFGLPTIYFALQGLAVLFERSAFAQSLGLGRGGWHGRLFALTVVVAPAFWLFHPPFIHNVILPFLQAIGATGGQIT